MEFSNRVYHKNNLGSTFQCDCHSGIHLNFGNVSLLLSKPQIRGLATYVRATIAEERFAVDPEDRSIHIPTRDQSMMFVMSLNELKDLFELLDHTLLMIEVDDMLDVK